MAEGSGGALPTGQRPTICLCSAPGLCNPLKKVGVLSAHRCGLRASQEENRLLKMLLSNARSSGHNDAVGGHN